MIRFTLILCTLLFLQSCGLTDRFFNSNDDCDDGSCEAPVLLDNSAPEQKWFCYGSDPDEPWQCQNSQDDSKIVAVKPEPVSQVAETRSTPAPVIAQSQPEPPPAAKLPADTLTEQILNSPAGHYAVQLIALRELSGVLEYATLNGIPEPQYVKIRNDQTDWYILLLGTYPDRTLAEAAKREWETAKVLRVQPWIRQLGGLQDAIRLAQDAT